MTAINAPYSRSVYSEISIIYRKYFLLRTLPTFSSEDLYWCFHVLREKCRLRVFENRVFRKIFGPNTDEIIGEWRRLQNK
jgi:hypothetical protein